MNKEQNGNELYPVLGNVEIVVRSKFGEVRGDKKSIFNMLSTAKANHYLVAVYVEGEIQYLEETAAKQPIIEVFENGFLLSIQDCLNTKEIEAARILHATATIAKWHNQS